MCLFFHVEDNGVLVECAYSLLRLMFNTVQLRFYHWLKQSLHMQMGSVTPYFRPCCEECS